MTASLRAVQARGLKVLEVVPVNPKSNLPSRLLDESIDRTLAVFQPMTDRRLTRQDAHEIRSNLLGFVQTLRECADAQATAAAAGVER